MPYDFDTIINRTATNSIKWSYRKELEGREDVIPMWVADMDYAVAPEIAEAGRARRTPFTVTRVGPTGISRRYMSQESLAKVIGSEPEPIKKIA